MAALTCSDCERPAVRSCVCAFPLPLLCEEHRLSHSADSHFPLPLSALRHVQNIETQVELNERVSKLRRLHSLVNLYSDPQQQSTIDIRDLLMQFYKDVEDLKAKVKELKAESIREEDVKDEWTLGGATDILSALIWSETCPEDELGTWISIGHALSLKTKFQYEESCRVLEDRWKLVQSNKKVEVLVLSLILSEVMGLHIGRLEEALAILEKSFEVANELCLKSEISLQLANMESAIFISFSIFNIPQTYGGHYYNLALQYYYDAPTSEVSLGTALYLYVTTGLSRGYDTSSKEEAIRKKWMLKTKNSSNSLIEHIRLYQSALLKMMGVSSDLEGAENLMSAAEELAKRDFPTSIYAVLSMSMNYEIRRKKKKLEDEADFNHDDEFLRVHFPASLLRANILESKAEFYRRMQDKNKELEVRFLIYQLQQRSLRDDSCALNVTKIANIKFDNYQVALDLLESNHRLLFERSFASIAFSHSLTSLSYFYQTYKLPAKEFEMYVETIRKLQATDPTHKLLSEVLITLAKWDEDTQREKARQICVELYQFLRDNYPRCENYYSAAKTVGMMHKVQKQREKMEDIMVESIQIAKTFYKFADYVQFIGTILNLGKFSNEKTVAILDEIYAFLISNIDSDCLCTSYIIKNLFSDQPERLLTILLAVYRTLLASPTNSALGYYLAELTTFYHETKQLDKEIEARLEVHQLLLDHVTCENFGINVEGIVAYYWDQEQREKAIQFQVKMSRLLSAHPTSYNYLQIMKSLFSNCSKESRRDIALEQYTEAYRTLQPAANPQHSWIATHLCQLHDEMGNRDIAIQLAQECMNSLTLLTQEGQEFLALLEKLCSKSKQYQQVIDMCMNAIQIFSENEWYSEISCALRKLFDNSNSMMKYETIEKLIEIISGVEEIRQWDLLRLLLSNLPNFLKGKTLDTKQKIAIQKRVFHQILFLRSRHMSQFSEHLCDAGTGYTLRQIGGLYWQAHEKQRLEVYLFKAVRADLRSCLSHREERIRDYRLLFNDERELSFSFIFP